MTEYASTSLQEPIVNGGKRAKIPKAKNMDDLKKEVCMVSKFVDSASRCCGVGYWVSGSSFGRVP